MTIVTEMEKASRSMRCFLKRTENTSLVQFSDSCEDASDSGDAGGIKVFTFWSISDFGMFIFLSIYTLSRS